MPTVLVDLTMPIFTGMPVFSGNSPVSISRHVSYQNGGCLEHTVSMGVHSGTHLDAPAHMFPGGRNLDDYEIECFFGPGRLIDARKGLGEHSLIDDILPGEIVLLWTGLTDRVQDQNYYEQVPRLSVSVIQGIINRGPKMIGVDAGSIDAAPFELHKAILGAGILLAENLTQLALLAHTRFHLSALPIRLPVEAAPARVVARTDP